jgi:hypothetical protein
MSAASYVAVLSRLFSHDIIQRMDMPAPLPADLSTPYVAVDLDVLDRNLRAMAARACAVPNLCVGPVN